MKIKVYSDAKKFFKIPVKFFFHLIFTLFTLLRGIHPHVGL